MVERNAEVAPDKRIEFRIGIHLGDVVEESDPVERYNTSVSADICGVFEIGPTHAAFDSTISLA
jgi:hypothetical protein